MVSSTTIGWLIIDGLINGADVYHQPMDEYAIGIFINDEPFNGWLTMISPLMVDDG